MKARTVQSPTFSRARFARESSFLFLLALLLAAPDALATPRYVAVGGADAGVCSTALAPCATIQYAILVAAPGDVIYVGTGTYSGGIVVNKAVTLNGAKAGVSTAFRSAGSGETVIDASGSQQGFTIAASGVVIDGFEITGDATTWAGVGMFGTYSNVTIQYNLIHGFEGVDPNASTYFYSIGVWGLGGGTPGSRGQFTNIAVTDNRIYDLGGAVVAPSLTSGGAGVLFYSTWGIVPGAGLSVTGNRFSDLADGSTLLSALPGIGVSIIQDDEPASIDSGVLVSGNTYSNVTGGVAIHADMSSVVEDHDLFTNVVVFVLNAAGLATVDEDLLSPFARSDDPNAAPWVLPAGSVAYFVDLEHAFDYSGGTASILIVGELSGTNRGRSDVQIWLEGGDLVIEQNGVEIFRGPVPSIFDIEIFGLSGNDTLSIDFSNGNPIPAGGLHFHGGSGADSIVMTGGSATTVTHTFYSENDGDIDVDGSMIYYTGLDPILDLVPAVNRVFHFGPAIDVVTLGDDPTPGNGRSFIDSPLSEEVTFLNPTGTVQVRTFGGADHVTVNRLDSGFVGSVSILGGDGSDLFTIWPYANYSIAVNGGSPVVAPGDVLDVVFTGLTGATRTSAGPAGSWLFTNASPLTFVGIETHVDNPLSADLSVSKGVDHSDVYEQDVLTFTITVTNHGPANASGVTVTDLLPGGLTSVGVATATSGTVAGAGSLVTWSGISVPAASSATLVFKTTAATGLSGTVVNMASITTSSRPDSDASNNSSSVSLRYRQPMLFPPGHVVQALAFRLNSLSQWETLAGTFNFGLYRSAPSWPGSRWIPVQSGLPAPLVVNDLLVASNGWVYLAATGYEGLYVSNDGARSFAPVDFGEHDITIVQAVDESPVDGAIYLSADIGRIFRYDPAVMMWVYAGSLPGGSSQTPWSLAAHPTVPGRVFAGTFGYGVFRSDDYGATWRHVSGADFPHAGNIHVFDLEFDPELTSPMTLWAGTAVGVFYSQDNGATWTDASAGMGPAREVRSIAFGPIDPAPAATGKMYAATWGGGVYEMPSNRATVPAWDVLALRGQQVGTVGVSPDGSVLLAAPSGGGAMVFSLGSATAVEESESTDVPAVFSLDQNYPNPFNPQTNIRFELDSPAAVRLTVHDLTGRLVAVLVDGHRDGGSHEVRFDASRLSSGAYLYRLDDGSRTVNRIMLLTR